MASHYGVSLAALDDLPARGATVAGALSGAYRVARRLLQHPGGLMDVIEPVAGVDYPEAGHATVDVREWVGMSVGPGDLDELRAAATAAVTEDPAVESAEVEVTFGDREISITVRATGTDGDLGFVLSVNDVTAATLRVI